MTVLQSSENRPADRETHPKNDKEEDPKLVQYYNTLPVQVPPPADNASENLPYTNAVTNPTTALGTNPPSSADLVRTGLKEEIAKQVVRKKLAKLRHLVLEKAIHPEYLDSLFPRLLPLFQPQPVVYNGGIANVKNWKISCYLEVMEGGVPTANPNLELLDLFQPLLDECNYLFLYWFRQKSACNNKSNKSNNDQLTCSRLMTFITRYTPAPGEQALLKVRLMNPQNELPDDCSFQETPQCYYTPFMEYTVYWQHVDGSGKVDGSVVVALPIDRWSAPESVNSFVGHGGVSSNAAFLASDIISIL
jgi:hypothetical protein